MDQRRAPRGTPIGGQFTSAERPVVEVSLHVLETIDDIAFNPSFQTCLDAWDDTEDPDSHLMDEIYEWGNRIALSTDPEHRNLDRLDEALGYWESLDEHDLDAANDIATAMRTLLLRVVDQRGRSGGAIKPPPHT